MGTCYIKREDAIKATWKELTYTDPLNVLTKIRDKIEAIPAADVEEVRHGYYQGEYDGYADGAPVYDLWYCSECGHYFEEWDEKPTYNYCPNCGAKMDDEDYEEAGDEPVDETERQSRKCEFNSIENSKDVAEVVRCKECLYFHTYKMASYGDEINLCDIRAMNWPEDNRFCSFGERKYDD